MSEPRIDAVRRFPMSPTQSLEARREADTVETVPVRALLLGERLDTRALEGDQPLGVAPLAVAIPGGGVGVLFRYGAVVLLGPATAAEDDFIASLMPKVSGALAIPGRDEARLLIRPDADQPVDLAGNIVLRESTTERLQLVADILAKGLVLSYYETRIAEIFDGIEPLAAMLREKGRAGASGKELLRHIGDVLLIQQKMVGRVETGEKPELLWEHPELERLYVRLAEEYELRDRDRVLDRSKTPIPGFSAIASAILIAFKPNANPRWIPDVQKLLYSIRRVVHLYYLGQSLPPEASHWTLCSLLAKNYKSSAPLFRPK